MLESEAATFASVQFEKLNLLGDYGAYVDRPNELIEAKLVSTSRTAGGVFNRLRRLPGVEIQDTQVSDDDEEQVAPSWRLVLDSDPTRLEISSPSPLMKVLFSGSNPTIKITGVPIGRNDQELEALQRIAGGLFFDFDLRYGIAIDLMQIRSLELLPRLPRDARPPDFPRNRYPQEPLSLYTYGRSAAGLPLLEFLAYYQCLEFFFPSYAKVDAIRNMRSALKDPRFNSEEDVSIARLIGLAAPAARTGASERDQLRTTLRSCLTGDELREFINSDEQLTDYFCAKVQAIQGVTRLFLDRADMDIRDQVADRLYEIRCRIVHTKQDGGEQGVDLLLPSGREARARWVQTFAWHG